MEHPEPTPTIASMALTVGELRSEFLDNEVAANAKYQSNTVLVSGHISSVSEESSHFNVYLDTGDFSVTGMVCRVDTNEINSVIPLSGDDPVSVQGKVLGLKTFNIVIDPCLVMEAPQSVMPPPTPTHTKNNPNSTYCYCRAAIFHLSG